jgi:hypothetical protein
MPPEQGKRLVDLVDDGLDFSAHRFPLEMNWQAEPGRGVRILPEPQYGV